MFLHEFCGSWMEHPFWRSKFLLSSPDDLARIRATPIQECWIDTSKGIDVPEGTGAVSRIEAEAQIDTDFSALEAQPLTNVVRPAQPTIPPRRNLAPADMQSELQLAGTSGFKS